MFLTVLRLSSCVCLLSLFADGSDSEQILQDNGVLVLTQHNFKKALKQHAELLVHFYAPLSGQSLGSILDFQDAARALKEAGSVVTLGGVNVNKEKDLAAMLNVTMVPSLRFYLSGDRDNPVNCPVLKSSTSILTWLKRREGPSTEIVNSFSQLQTFMAQDHLVVLGLFEDIKEGTVKVFYEAAMDVADLPFAVSENREIFREFESSEDTVVLIRKFQAVTRLKVGSSTVKNDLVQFIKHNEMDLVTEYNGKTATRILNSEVLNHLVLFINKADNGDTEEICHAFKTTAKKLRGQVLFVLVDVSEPRNGRIMEYFHVRSEMEPQVRMVNLSDHVQYLMPSDQFDTHNLFQFCLSYLEGKTKPKLQSEPIPENWDVHPVKELVGMNFEKVAFNNKKNVIVLFYAPWNSESVALFPLWENLAENFQKNEDVVVAKIDVTANDLHIHLEEKYPSVKLFPAVFAERVIPYAGTRDLMAIVTFMKKEIEKAKTDRIKEEIQRKKYIDAQKTALKEEL